jgi:hypothetical protein
MSARPIRVAVSAMPRLLRDLIEGAISLEPDLRLLATGDDPDLSASIRRGAVDVVVLGEQPASTAASHQQLLVDHPHLKIVVVTDDGRTASLVELRRVPVTVLSPRGLVDAILAAMAATGRGDGGGTQRN